jgi:hypothetical protein
MITRGGSAVRQALNRHRYPLPELRTTRVQLTAPTVYYCAPDFNRPSGGVRVAYRHVDLLNAAGFQACVLHHRAGFSCTWFEHQTPVCSAEQVQIGPLDVVVVGELAVDLIDQLPAGFRYVVFNQNQHLTWKRASPERVHRYTHSPDLAAVLTVSDYGCEVMRFMAPDVNVLRVHDSIDPELFFNGGGVTPRPRTIAYMPRRGHEDAKQVLGLLRNRGALDGWRLTEIDGVSERTVGAMLREACVFLSFSYQEGFGLPAAEALACGAYVVGFHGQGGREFFDPEWSIAIEAGDVLAFARGVEEVLAREQRDPGWCARRAARGARFVATEYSPARERDELTALFAQLIGAD